MKKINFIFFALNNFSHDRQIESHQSTLLLSITCFDLTHCHHMHIVQTNRTVENIGARRLHTVIERIVEEISFDAPDKAGQSFVIDEVRTPYSKH